jgi:hypothetical protein
VKCDFAIRKIKGGRMFESEEVEQLITEKQIGLARLPQQQGKPFAAVLKFSDEFKVVRPARSPAKTAKLRPRSISPARSRSANVRSAARGCSMPE